MSGRSPLRVGVAGGSRGGGYVAAIRSAGGRVTFQGIYDPDKTASKRFAAEYGVPAEFSSYEALVEGCDLIVLASPQQYHGPQACFALDRGVHVLSEVPAAVSTAQADHLLSAARRSGAKYMLAENYCYTRPNLIVGAMARQGVFGELYYGEGEYLHEMKQWHRLADGNPTWRYYWQVGRNGVTYPTHSLGPLLQWMNDRIVSVSCVGTGRWTDPEHELEDIVTLSARTRKGALIRMRLDLLSNRPELWDYYSLQGTGGGYEASRDGGTGRVYIEGETPRETWQPVDSFAGRFLPERFKRPPEGSGHWGSDTWPFLEFLDAIENDAQPPLDVYRALDMTLPGVASEQSIAQGGSWVHVPDPRTFTAGIGVEPGREAPLA